MISRLIILLLIVGCAEEIETYYSCIKYSDITSPYFSNYYVDSLNAVATNNIDEAISKCLEHFSGYYADTTWCECEEGMLWEF